MIVEECQRARGRRPAGELIRTSDYEVVPVRSRKTVRRFIVRWHYSGSFSQCSRPFELRHRGGELVGAAVFSVVSRRYRPHFGTPKAWLTLARFVLVDAVPGNGETFFLGRAFEHLRREGFAGVVSYSDPTPRPARDGRIIFPGHVGTIYQAHNGIFTGRSKPETKWLLPDGTMFESRSGNKVGAGHRGRRYAGATLVRFGAPELAPGEDPKAWLATWKRAICRPLKHPGNYRYLWTLDRSGRRFMPPTLPYPKVTLPPVEPRRRRARP